MDPPIIQEINIANKACRPIKGVKDKDIPVAKPKDKACGEPFILLILKLMYFFVLEKANKAIKILNSLVSKLFFLLLPNGMSYLINLLPGFTAGICFKFNGILSLVNIGALIFTKLV